VFSKEGIYILLPPEQIWEEQCEKSPFSILVHRGFYIIMNDKINCDIHDVLLLDIKCFFFFQKSGKIMHQIYWKHATEFIQINWIYKALWVYISHMEDLCSIDTILVKVKGQPYQTLKELLLTMEMVFSYACNIKHRILKYIVLTWNRKLNTQHIYHLLFSRTIFETLEEKSKWWLPPGFFHQGSLILKLTEIIFNYRTELKS